MTPLSTRNARLLMALTLVGITVAGGTLFADTAGEIRVPADFKHGYLVNSLLITKKANRLGITSGNHLIYVNSIGFARLTQGAGTPYPDGTVFVDDVRNYTTDDGIYSQGNRKFVTVMVKNSMKYAATGGWGFQAWPEGDPSKPVVTDSVKQCFACHTPQKANDYVYSTYLH